MPVIEPVIRPPSESKSFLLQITTGCSSDTCTFCGAYKGKPFAIKERQEIYSDIERASNAFAYTRRVFLMDGDALVMNNNRLLPILKKLQTSFPRLARISSYANGYNITKRDHNELCELYNNKLSLIYIGLESGSQQILDNCKKRTSVKEMKDAVIKAGCADIKSSVMVLLGLGGKKNSAEHIEKTIVALNEMQPRYLSFLSLMLIPKTELYKTAASGEFKELNSKELLMETRDIIKGLELNKTIFRCNHASNYFPIEGRFPQDKEKLIKLIEKAVSGNMFLKPDFLRGL
ncbi:MAG: radical SAM protein [Candidatus Aureabacteria bacterium]|nr:radical SAM protein [Candidatus Auribacterota bacterium]